MWDTIRDWFFGLGAAYGVDPLVFGAIYVGAIPFFLVSSWWLVRTLRQGKPAAVPALATGFFFVSAYLYLIVVGRNVPVWVYAAVVLLVVGGAVSTVRKIRARVAE